MAWPWWLRWLEAARRGLLVSPKAIADESRASKTQKTTRSGSSAFDLVELTRKLREANEEAVMHMLQTHLCDSQLQEAMKETIVSASLYLLLRWACYRGSRAIVLDTQRSPDIPVDKHGRTPLYIASQQGRTEIVKLLLGMGANANKTSLYGWTPLYAASQLGHTEVVELLLKAGADVHATIENGRTAMYTASQQGHLRVVELLLGYGADVNLVGEDAQTPVYNASWRDHTKIITLLLEKGADTTLTAEYGWTPLHAACARLSLTVVMLLAPRGTSALEDDDGYRPLHLALLRVWHQGCSETALKVLRALVASGSEWDTTCDHISSSVIAWPLSMGEKPSDTNNGRWKREAPALRACIERWAQEREQDVRFTEVPIEDVRRGVEATKTYIMAFATSLNVVFRRKICVVGPGCWGKTSLLKSLTTGMPSLVHVDDRTIGIDHFKLEFEELLQGLKSTKKHEVTFWDFAGQDAYQVTHSLFFSARTLYMVCIDLHAFLTAWMQAQLMTDTDTEVEEWVNDFIDSKILRWIRVICARQPDAEFVFVVTKKDRILVSDLNNADGVLTELQKRMVNVEVIIEEMKKEVDKNREGDQDPSRAELSSPITHLGDSRLANMSKTRRTDIIVTSCTKVADVKDFKSKIEGVIKKSDRGYPMPDKYTRVLKALLQMKEAAAATAPDERLEQSILGLKELYTALALQLKGSHDGQDTLTSAEPYLDEDTCEIILGTLRDLGDVLWYKRIGDQELKKKIIIDPMLMIDLVREIFNHKLTAEVMTHRTLQGLKYWKHLEGTAGMLSLKRLFQYFYLVYPTTPEMKADSNLIVPAFWQTKMSGFWKFGGGDLRFGPGIEREVVAVRVHWEFLFVNNYPHTLFDHLVVASYSPYHPRDIGPDWIMYMTKDKCACRLVLKRALNTHRWILHLEAIQGLKATDDDEKYLWECFLLLLKQMEKVISDYPGVVVSRFAQEDVQEDVAQHTHPLESLEGREQSVLSRKWMPPQVIWEACLTIWKGEEESILGGRTTSPTTHDIVRRRGRRVQQSAAFPSSRKSPTSHTRQIRSVARISVRSPTHTKR